MKRHGFTLIELSIVLIIIGLIIGGVMKGKDLISNAKQKNIYSTWIQAWVVAVNAYEDRTGGTLGDGVVNGGTQANEDGRFDTINLSSTTGVQNILKSVGLDAPAVGLNNGGSYGISGKYSTSNSIAILQYLQSHTDGGSKNKLYITGVPTDVAMAFDRLSDGKLDPVSGFFRRYPDNSAAKWPDPAVTLTVDVTLNL
ncbi:prepilin-type N-terminal cleavage/methylation domain-containing protein [Candidatus Sulfurimonas baltica]|uniref:Prepilin-type N-terminal cleavage/methylation domain-containing protein n=1 Tax=Candidatus Sulfurimonas baltica TaxID=2740404 RepID=A0A7S7RP32_9BACT|nr:prepilin-type N-terminal cleavage/methylation domain-containing protein [Candidatus Sulfurimonas baltica]QOY53055.1 prepilin-type N-terminal cleavage/methylation domain-containing protein [Candidatus Sulfurimonas baltica]